MAGYEWEYYGVLDLISEVTRVQGEDEDDVQMLSEALVFGTEVVMDTPGHPMRDSTLELIRLGLDRAKAERTLRQTQLDAATRQLRSGLTGLPVRTVNKTPSGLPSRTANKTPR